MIHSICDFCGKDTGRCAHLVTITPFQNFARFHGDVKPFGATGEPHSFVMCEDCLTAHRLPNPYKNYGKIDSQRMSYAVNLDNIDAVAGNDGANGSGDSDGPVDTGAVSGGDAMELIGQLIDCVEDFVSDRSRDSEEVHVKGKDYDELWGRFARTMANWNLVRIDVAGGKDGDCR